MRKAIIFDFYGVICSEIGSRWYQTRPSQELVPELMEKYDAPSDSGQISEEEFFAGIAGSVSSTGDSVRREWLAAVVIDSELIELIKELKKNYMLAICSNTVSSLFREIIKAHDIEKLFDVIVASSEVGLVKPHADIFEYTLEKLSVRAQEAIFIDDRETNTNAAESVGIASVLYVNATLLRSELAKLLQS